MIRTRVYHALSQRASGDQVKISHPIDIFTLFTPSWKVREAEFGEAETHQLQDIRRSGTVEAFAGGANAVSVSRKMANTLDEATNLQETYNPSQTAVVRTVDDARLIGRSILREQSAKKTVTGPAGKLSLALDANRKSLK